MILYSLSFNFSIKGSLQSSNSSANQKSDILKTYLGEFKKADAGLPLNDSSWLVEYDEQPSFIIAEYERRLKEHSLFLDENDSIVILPIKPSLPFDGWLTEETKKWLKIKLHED